MPRPTTTRQWVLANKPDGLPILGDGPDATWRLQEMPLRPLKEGEVLGRVRYISNDTGLRGFISTSVAPERYYVPLVEVGQAMRAGVITEVLESKSDRFKPGDMLMDYHLGCWGEHVILDVTKSQPLLSPVPEGVSLTNYVGALGASGLTAFTGLKHVGQLKPGQTVVVSAAAGATGSMVVQIARKILGAGRVIGIAGTDEKCQFVKNELGADECLNYRSPTFEQDLKAATPDEVDLYFDNVGGHILDVMLTRVKKFGRIAVCGLVSTYNSAADEPMTLRNMFEVVSCGLTIQGFIMLDYIDKVPQMMADLVEGVQKGLISLKHSEQVVEASIEKQPEIFMSLFKGANKGKLVTSLQT
ncbi:hypothetical protein GGTG_10322 [Gaeumannomyces tritici R3-111a-1]|uniref:Dehydrogenase FUB6 n=1 Tax=Gaeumannomyces tritici (strain R3-111a-1) TaxID=644352 RepID=J3P9Z8_GAET3|nr:hypothetical protein GGTG_10322 [Gaeumannomyces tritici R3-111a-1]EJT73484.1 hypothetical protein GGTG_10322 [Gaeumannomyces tritici R3-111a-1]